MIELPTIPNPAAMRVTSLPMSKMTPWKLSNLELWQPMKRHSSATL